MIRLKYLAFYILSFFISTEVYSQCSDPIELSNNIVNSQIKPGQVIGQFSYSCIPNEHDVEYRIKQSFGDLNILSLFEIQGNSLVGKQSFLCIRTSYKITIEAISVLDNRILNVANFDIYINCPPKALFLTQYSYEKPYPFVYENKPLLTEIGTLSAVDTDSDPSQLTYSIVEDGEGDYRFFTIQGDKLLSNHSFDYEYAPPNLNHEDRKGKITYNLSIRVEDQGKQGIVRSFAISVEDLIGKMDQNGIADQEVANHYGVSEGDFLILNRYHQNTNNIYYNVNRPIESSLIEIAPNKAIRIKGDHYGVIGFNLELTAKPDNPITITNFLGQVRCTQLKIYNGHNYRVTGKYDTDQNTGSPHFKGPQWQNGTTDFGFSSGKYGIMIQDFDWVRSLTATPSTPIPSLLELGGTYGETTTDINSDNVEIDHIEMLGAGFAGIRAGNAKATGTMDNLNIHHNYIHDVFSEGIYLSQTKSTHGGGKPFTLTKLKVENNLIVRTGSEAIQVQYAQDHCRINNNVAWGGVAWLDPFQAYQDNVVQLHAIDGNNSVENNIILGGGEKFVILFTEKYPDYSPIGGELLLKNNLMYSSPGTQALYLDRNTNNATSYRIDNNFFGQMEYDYNRYDPKKDEAKNLINIATVVSGVSTVQALSNYNQWEASPTKNNFIGYSVPAANIGRSDNQNTIQTVQPPQFVNSIGTFTNQYKQWHLYTNTKTFFRGEIVMSPNSRGELRFYECTEETNEGEDPVEGHPLWTLLTWSTPKGGISFLPPDNFNLMDNTFYKNRNIGLNN